jgi:glycosyltransferase involved in cell wall biosynthesis/ubiquinone/menaquinone biosynthesis C-methylase UbiE
MKTHPEHPDIETSSAGYAQRFAGRAGAYLLRIQEKALARTLRGCAPGRALDVGGGHGQLVDPLRSLGWSVTVLGSSEECERNLRTLHGKYGCEFVCSDLLSLPFPDASFELVTSVRLLSHVEEWERFLAELCRVSAKWVVIDYPSTSGLNALTPLLFKVKKGLEGNTRTYRSFSKRELERALSSHGYTKGAVAKQFVLPMALHRICGSAAPLRLAESASRAVGLTALAGSPVILRADRAVLASDKLRILLVAPQPFYQERGTPIAVRMLAETLCDAGHEVDLLTYHEGLDIEFPRLRIVRSPRIAGVSNIPIGISWKKLVCDVALTARLAQLLLRNRYDVVHAVEESVFPAALFNLLAGKLLVYDMDSLLSEQLVTKWRALSPVASLLRAAERLVLRRSDHVFAVCEDLAERARDCLPADRVTLLPDAPVAIHDCNATAENLREYVGDGDLIALYIGNLEKYQGVDLLIDAAALLPREARIVLLVIGGSERHIAERAGHVRLLGIADRVRFLGPRPLTALHHLLAQADILLSPRVFGSNTPLKLYSYMESGKPIVATRVRSHSQVLDDECAVLCKPEAPALARGLKRLIDDCALRERLGLAAARRVRTEYSLRAYQRRLLHAYSQLAKQRPTHAWAQKIPHHEERT